MAAPQQTIKKPAEKTQTAKAPAAPKSEKELRAAFGTASNKILKSLSRAASRAERIMRKNAASDAQLEAFHKGTETLTGRIVRAARGENAPQGDLVPLE